MSKNHHSNGTSGIESSIHTCGPTLTVVDELYFTTWFTDVHLVNFLRGYVGKKFWVHGNGWLFHKADEVSSQNLMCAIPACLLTVKFRGSNSPSPKLVFSKQIDSYLQGLVANGTHIMYSNISGGSKPVKEFWHLPNRLYCHLVIGKNEVLKVATVLVLSVPKICWMLP